MPDTALTNQLPPKTTSSTGGSRKWSTLGTRGTSASSTTKIPTNDSDINENSSKTNGRSRHSTSLFRKASTISRTNDTPVTSDENSSTSLKKSRSLMNVLRSKLNSPAVLRRFRSKSRESTKQTTTEINGHTTNDEQQETKQSNNEQISTRKSRKRDPSPMRRLANRISQLTRHQRTTSNERQKKSPSKSITNDSHDEPRKSSSPLHNKNEADHINACYDEIRAKYFNNNTSKRNTSNEDTQDRPINTISMNDSLLSNDILNNSPRLIAPLPLSDDPLLQARKKSNIKLNCMLSGYTLTRSFANHEKSYGQNDLFKFHHYYDVGTRKYDWNFTNQNNRIYSSMRTRPISKSIDSFRHTNTNENQIPVKLDKINIVDNYSLENHQDVPRILPNDNELFIYEDNDLIESKQNTSQYSSDIHVTPTAPIPSILSDKNEQVVEEHDEEFERNFLRAVDRALGVVNKDENSLTELNDDIPKEKDESHLNLIQMTEQALSSFNNSPFFTNDDQKNDNNIVENQEQINNDKELVNTEVVDNPDESSKTEVVDHSAESSNTEVVDHPAVSLKTEVVDHPDESSNTVVVAHPDESSNTEVVDHPDESSNTEVVDHPDESSNTVVVDHPDEPSNTVVIDHPDESLNTEVVDHPDASLNNEELLKIDIEKQEETKPTSDDLIDEDIQSIIDDLIQKIEESLFEETKNGQTFLAKLDDEEKIIKLKADSYNKYVQSVDNRLTEDVRTDINAVIGEVNLLLKGKLKQFRGLCEANVTKLSSGEPIPLDSDLEGFWDITFPLIDKVKEKFGKLDARKAKQWAPVEEYDPHDINNRPRVIDDRLKQLQPQQNKSTKVSTTKSANDDLKKLIQERRKAAANARNQNHDIEIFVAPK